MRRDDIAVRIHGDGPGPVWVLHGGPGAPGSVTSLAADLAQDFQVYEPHQRGSGGAPLTVARHVEDLADVMTAPGVLVGWSWGAMLALSFAALAPRPVRALVLVGCGTYDLESRAVYRRAMDARDGNQDVDPLPEIDEVTFDRTGFEQTWEDVLRLQAEGIEPGRFASIRAPVTMLHGADDPHPGPSTRDVLRGALPQLDYVELGRCGHRPWRERHARDAFLTELRARIVEGLEAPPDEARGSSLG